MVIDSSYVLKHFTESTQAKGKAVCTKDKGYYEPPYLATCLASHAFENGRFEQIWNLVSAGGTVSCVLLQTLANV